MTKEQHINYWVDTAQYDWDGAGSAFDSKNYMRALFWAHLVIEKLAKAHWVRTHEDNFPPRIHNIVWLLEESGINLGDDMMSFLKKFNEFQLSGRYPDYTKNIYRMCTNEFTFEQLEKAKEVRTCLLKML
jgi:HEPN domain-containing protein